MSFKEHMQGYSDLRTLYQIDALHALKHGENPPPALVEIDPNSNCNQKCIYCYSYDRLPKNTRIPDEVFVSLFDQIADAGTNTVLLQGTGEPLLHKAIPEAVERAANRGLTIGVNTNGIPLNQKMQDQILDKLFYIKFSVIDASPDRYAEAHGCTTKQWDILIENMKNAVELRQRNNLGVALWATLYLEKNNFNEAYACARFFKNLGLDYIVVQEATYTKYSPAGKKEYASAEYEHDEIDAMKETLYSLNDDDFRIKVVFPLINDAMNYAGQTKEGFIPDFCLGPKLYTTVCCDGEVYPCWRMWGRGSDFSYGSIYENTFSEIWSSRKRKEIEKIILTKPPEGQECLVCNHARLNEILYNFMNADSQWKDFII